MRAGAEIQLAPLSSKRIWDGQTLALVALGACWLLFFNQLRAEWQVNAQYNFGYVVPLLGAALLRLRWPDRPAASSPAAPFLGVVVVVTLLLLQLPLHLALEANPEWRLLYWVNGFQVLGLTLCFLYRQGGAPWVRHFGPPLVFILIAVPWPMGLEQWAIQGLMRFVAGLTVEVASLLGIPAVQHGNLIEVGVGMVGIDEACSGVRSLQSGLMLSLFLGEMHRFSWLRRAGLLGASLLFVLLANLTRTTFLVWAAASRGLHQMESWHDTAGTVIMLVVLPSLLGLAHLLKPKASPHAPQRPGAADVFPKLPRWIGISTLAWLLMIHLATESWYRHHEASLIPNLRWSVTWPVQDPQFTRTAVPENSLAILRCSESTAASWRDDEGNRWSAFLLRWNPGRNSTQLSKGHRPDICFPAAGARLVEDFGAVTLDAGGVEMAFHHQSFESGTKLLHVFYCLWPDRLSPHEKPLIEDGSQASRLLAVMAGKRNLGQQVLEIVVEGPDSGDASVALVKAKLPLLVKRD
jgi:exosortase